MQPSCELIFTVTENLTAKEMGSGQLRVLATPALVAKMEQCAVNCVGTLPETSSTVGTHIAIDHLKASPVDAKIRVLCTCTAQEGRQYTFSIEAYENEALIAKAHHVRFAVDIERFLSKIY